MRFYLDEDQSYRIAAIARSLGVDIVTTRDLGRGAASDAEQLALAAELGRVLVTRNYDDFARFTRRFLEEGRPHAGVLFVPRSLRGQYEAAIARAIARYDRDHPEGMPPYMIDYLRWPGD